MVGTHFEGTREVRDHVLDRSKFDPGRLTPLADQIYTTLKSGTPDNDGFVAGAYFNSRLFALSVYIVNGVSSGQNIKTYEGQVKELGQDPLVSGWLAASQFAAAYSALLAKLDAVTLKYTTGSSLADLQHDFESSAEHLKQLRRKADSYRLSDPDAYNSLVPIYNSYLKRTRRFADRLEFQSTAADDLDLAFNRCMDPAILMSKFDKVDLTQTGQSRSSDFFDTPVR